MTTFNKGLLLNQRKYILDLLKESNMSDARHAHTYLTTTLEGKPLPNIGYYQRLVGKLIYLTITRLDITLVVSIAKQFMHSPTLEHFNLVKRILQYLKGSVGHRIIMRKKCKYLSDRVL